MTDGAIQKILDDGDLNDLKMACIDSVKFSRDERIQTLQQRLLKLSKQNKSFQRVVANAEALMACKAPGAARKVLSLIAPAEGEDRRDWLLLSWRIASASMDHSRAAIALRRLVRGKIQDLDNEDLVVGHLENGSPITISALDVLAQHEKYMGNVQSAVSVLLAGTKDGITKARRLFLAAELVTGLSGQKYQEFLDLAFKQAETEEAWGLALDILRLRLKLDLASEADASITKKRLENLSRRLDDRYTLMKLLSDD